MAPQQQTGQLAGGRLASQQYQQQQQQQQPPPPPQPSNPVCDVPAQVTGSEQQVSVCEPTGEQAKEESSPAMALYAPLALVGATSQVIDFNAIAASRNQNQNQNQVSVASNGLGTIVTITGSSPATSSTSVAAGGQAGLVVSQREGDRVAETHLSRVDSVKSAASVGSLALVAAPGEGRDQQQQQPIRAILRNRLLPGLGGEQAATCDEETSGPNNQSAGARQQQQQPQQQQQAQAGAASGSTRPTATVRTVGYDSSTLMKKNSDGKCAAPSSARPRKLPPAARCRL